jgi:mono/diheme cytochrome c family protein
MRGWAFTMRASAWTVFAVALWATPAHAEGDAVNGQKVYQANCVACHGAKADGNGPAAAALRPPPADFTSAAFWEGRSDAKVKATIRSGKPGTPMMAYGQLSDAALADVVAFLRSKAQTGG